MVIQSGGVESQLTLWSWAVKMSKNENMRVNYAGVMAMRARSYKKHFAPLTATVDLFENAVQEYLADNYAGENVFIKTIREGKRPHSRLWEWNLGYMLHGVSAKSWLEDKLRTSFGYSNRRVKEYFDALVIVTVSFDEEDCGIQIIEEVKCPPEQSRVK